MSNSSAPYVKPPARELLEGARDQIPILIGVIPFGLIFGALALSAGIRPLAVQGFSLFVFAGSAQFIAASLVGIGTPYTIIALTILVVNLRHALYSATLSPHFRELSRIWKLILSWLLTDEAFAVASSRYARGGGANAHWYTLGTGLTLWITWQISTAVGIGLGATIPAAWSLDFVISLTFLALVVPSITDRASAASAVAAGVLALVLFGLPFRLGVLLAALFAVALGTALDLRSH
jgi:4-azaleucine resistance transporter AzlC